jgi:hydrogenase nickel incorporation protein HypB
MAVIEGDLQTDNDAAAAWPPPAPRPCSVNTEARCHLDSSMIEDASRLDMEGPGHPVHRERGNLVCPAEFLLGRDHKDHHPLCHLRATTSPKNIP